jgi:hypothetical protein
MPKRFLLTPDVFSVQNSPKDTARFLHLYDAPRRISQLNLVRDANDCLVVPAEQALVMMGTTPELTEELEALRSSGIKSFVTGQAGTYVLPRFAGRTKTTDDGGFSLKSDTVSVIVLCGSQVQFDENIWTKLLGGGSLSLATLIDTELDTIRALEAN